MEKRTIDGIKTFLYPMHESDATHRYKDWLNDKDVNRYLKTKGCKNLRELRNYIIDCNDDPNVLLLGIYDKERHLHIGNIKLTQTEPKVGEIGIMIGEKDFWGKGYAKEAIKNLMEYGINVLNFKMFRLGVEKENERAMKLYQNIGFKIYDANINEYRLEYVSEEC